MKARTWSIISVVCFCAAIGFWMLGNRTQQRQMEAMTTNSAGQQLGNAVAPVRLLSAPNLTNDSEARNGSAPADLSKPPASTNHSVPRDPLFPFRLRNTDQTLEALSRSDTAILLRNAIIDTSIEPSLPIPSHLRAGDDPGAYLVQSRKSADVSFLNSLSDMGAALVSYIPNNTWLVRASREAAKQIRSSPLVRAVLPYEPYYKIDPQLLPLAVDQQPLPEGTRLVITAFPDAGSQLNRALVARNANVLGENRTPFGPQFIAEVSSGALPALAGLPEVQLIEPWSPRVLLNDLTRVRIGVSETTLSTNTNYFNLTGDKIWVNMNDSAVDSSHPDLEGRVFGETNVISGDPIGHGTHVAGTIASSGLKSPNGTNAPGSVEGASFRGMAPSTKLLVLPVDLVFGPPVSDSYLQETAALTNYVVLQRTNVMVSNNSWGYGNRFDYDSAAASYDAATRDAVPTMTDLTNSQAMLFVFAAGNYGNGNDVGSGGEPGTINSPATAKNVITVGAIDSPRFIYYTNITEELVTNIIDDEFVVTNMLVTNIVYLGETDSDDEVAPFSSRGNVGIGLESTAGRFKPDLVAPGAMLVSTRPIKPESVWADWDPTINITNQQVNNYPAQTVPHHQTNQYSIYVPANATRLTIEVLTNLSSPSPFPTLPIYVNQGDFPYNVEPFRTNRVVIPNERFPNLVEGNWFYGIGNETASSVDFDLRTILEFRVDTGSYSNTLKQLSEDLGPYYRAKSGTSGAAAAVSGLLALVQEFFEQQLKTNYSPALLKAILINGARSLSPQYNFQVRNNINYQGWGIVNLTNSLPRTLTNALDKPESWPVAWIDQNPTNALATGQTNQYSLSIEPGATNGNLRITLVWTDPPGNPAASYKLVNDLDLIVSNNVSGTVYIGNDIPASSDFNQPNSIDNLAAYDNVNNVENVFIRAPVDTNYTILVSARRVNVNAVNTHTNGIVQDYALVVSSESTNAITLKPKIEDSPRPVAAAELTVVTNGIPLLYQRAGANSPLQIYPIGVTNQWHFYVFTNAYVEGMEGETNFGPYVAFVTFMPPELSTPRNEDADIDMYVTRSQDPRGDLYQADQLLLLETNAVRYAYKSLSAGGSETVVFTNAADGEVFYIGVKAEDQSAAEYGFFGISSPEPFSSIDENGNQITRGLRLPQAIPDGSPVTPGGTNIFAIAIYPMDLIQVVVSNSLYHEALGDLVGNLSHLNRFAVLNNHKSSDAAPGGFYSALYDDTGSGAFPNSQTTDGPGSLDNFVGLQGSGAWILTVVDNALGQTGYVQNLEMRLTPNLDLLAGAFVTLAPEQWRYAYIDVPPDVSRMIVSVTRLSAGPLELYLRRGVRPTRTDYDNMATLFPPGGELSQSIYDDPPLTAGRYFIGAYNPNASSISFYIYVKFERELPDVFRRTFVSTNVVSVGDLALNIGTNDVTSAMVISDIKVGLRINHPRASDLDIRIVSPRGQSVLLSESRGGTNWTAFGAETVLTNFHHVALTYLNASKTATLYLDGEPIRSKHIPEFGDRLVTWGDLYFGARPDFPTMTNQYRGMLDETDLYRRALSAPEIRAIYKFGGAGKPIDGLAARWLFDDDTGIDWLTNHTAIFTNLVIDYPGMFGRSLHFPDQNTGYAFVPRHPNLDLGAAEGLTIDAWISPSDLSTNRTIAVWADGTNSIGVEFFLQPGSDTNKPQGELAARLIDASGITNIIAAGPESQGLIRTNSLITNIVYATFTSDTNLAHTPIKFAGLTNEYTEIIPGFTGPATGASAHYTNQYISGFEFAVANPTATFCAKPAGTNLPTVVMDDPYPWQRTNGWVVTNGCVTVINSPLLAHTGTNLLALRNGHIRRWLPTRPGTEYKLQFTHRFQPLAPDIVAWWPGESSALDVIDSHHAEMLGTAAYTNAMVDQGFLFATNQVSMRVPDDRQLVATNEFTVELWFNLTNAIAVSNPPPLGGPMVFKAMNGSTTAVNYGLSAYQTGLEWWYNDPTVAGDIDSDHPTLELVRSKHAPTPGVFHHAAATTRQISTNRVELKLYMDGRLERHVTLPGTLTNTFLPTNSVNSPLLIGTNSITGEFFTGIMDEISIYQRALSETEIAEIYALHNVGKCPPPAAPRTRLTVGSSFSNVFSTYSTQWQTNSVTFVAESDETEFGLEALDPGVLLDSFELIEMAPRYFLPEEELTPFIGQVAAGEWHLQIVDRRFGVTNDIDPQLVSWQLDLTFAPPTYPIVRITNGVPYTNTIIGGATRYFLVEVPSTAQRATNTLVATTNLSLWYNPNSLPAGVTQYGDVQFLTNELAGIAVLATNGWWLALPDGTPAMPADPIASLPVGQLYYLAVKNEQTSPVDFSLQVDFYPDANRDICPDITTLPFGEFVVTNIPATNALQYYCYHVTDTAKCVSFNVLPLDGNVDLYIRNARSTPPLWPAPDWYEYSSENPGLFSEQIVVNQRSQVPLFPGNWYIGILNRETKAAQYVIYAEETAAYGEVPLQIGTPVTATAEPANDTCTYYALTVNAAVPALQFQLYNLTGNARLLISRNSRPGPSDALYSQDASKGMPANIVVCPSSSMPDLRGTWYIALLSRDPVPVTCSLSVSVPQPRLTTLLSGIAITNTAPSLGPGGDCVPEVYKFAVVPNATRAEFFLTPINGNVDLFVRKGDSPTSVLFDYMSTEPGILPESIRVTTNSVPVPLSGGDWYVYVYNADNHAVSYILQAIQYIGDTPVGVSFKPVISVTGNIITLQWFASPGLVFRVQYATQIAPSGDFVWIDIPGTVTSATTLYTFIDDGSLTGGPAPQKFYRVILEGGTPVDTSITVNISMAGGTVVLDWNSLPNLKFKVQYAPDIPGSGVINWSDVPGTVTSATGSYSFTDDGSQTGGKDKTKFYRVVLIP